MRPVWPGPREFAAYRAPIRYLPPETENAYVERVIAERRDDHRPIDSESVRRAIENGQRPDYPLPGLFLTPEEEVEIHAVGGSPFSHARMPSSGRDEKMLW
jgi:hypothetical protein